MPTLVTVYLFMIGILILCTAGTEGQLWERGASKRRQYSGVYGDKDIQPHFEDVARNVTAMVGQTVYLPCRVKHIRDKMVSWIRQRDLHILTSDVFTYTSDQRFRVLHGDASDDWTLQIRSVGEQDDGLYECQINTDPKMNRAVALHVRDGDMLDSPYTAPMYKGGKQEMVTKILGPEKQDVKVGSTVTFTCLITSHSRPPATISWYHGSSLVTFTSSRGGISLETEKSKSSSTKKLMITRVTPADAGNYTCLPFSGRPASVILEVVPGVQTQMMQGETRGNWNGYNGAETSLRSTTFAWITCIVLATILFR